VRAFQAGANRVEPWSDARTIAFGINVPAPLGDELVLTAITRSGGTAIAVDDADLLADLRAFGAREGLLLCPEGAACLTATRLLRARGWLADDDEVVVLNTGAGTKYPDTVDVSGVPVHAQR
jgi:threonine synthase